MTRSRVSLLAAGAVLGLLAPGTAGDLPTAAAAAPPITGTLVVRIAEGEQVAVDPRDALEEISATVSRCPLGCEVARDWSYLDGDSSWSLDHRAPTADPVSFHLWDRRETDSPVWGMQVTVDGSSRVLDLHAGSTSPRLVRVVLDAHPGSLVTVTNVTPPGRAADTVDVDGVVHHGLGRGSSLAGLGAPEDVDAEGLHGYPTVGQQLPTDAADPRALLRVTLRANSYGCPQGCTLTEFPGGRVISRWTSPRSGLLQTRTATTRIDGLQERGYTFLRGTDALPSSSEMAFGYVPDARIRHSDGTTVVPDATSIGGTVRRLGPGAAITYQPVNTQYFGRWLGVVATTSPAGGVIGVYVDGVRTTTVDLAAPQRTSRRVVASVLVPRGGRITVIDQTPDARRGAVVDTNGLAVIDSPADCDRC